MISFRRPESFLARILLSALFLWIAFSVAFVLRSRHLDPSPWSSIPDLLLLTVAAPFGVAALIAGFWVLGRAAAVRVVVVSVSVTAISLGYVWYRDAAEMDRRIAEAEHHQKLKQERHEKACGHLRSAPNPYDYIVCVQVEEDRLNNPSDATP